jgi:hypothetical protein
MTNSTAAVAQMGMLAPAPQTTKSAIAMSLLHRLIPEGYEDSSGFHYGKVPPFIDLNTENCGKGITEGNRANCG